MIYIVPYAMSRLSEAEIMGGVGFGDDEYPSSFYHHSDFSLLGNGSSTLNRDPYLPIENEPMGRKYDRTDFESSYPTVQRYPYSPAKMQEERYGVPMRLDGKGADYAAMARANASTVSKVMQREKMCSAPPAGAAQMAFAGQNTQGMFMIFMIFIFLLMVVLAYLQNLQIQKLYGIVETALKNK